MKTTTVELEGQKLCVPETWSFREPEVMAVVKNLRPDHTFVDATARYGVYAIVGATLAKAVIAFEPREACRKLLRKSLALNGCKNVTVSQYTLFSEKADGYIGVPVGDGRQWAMFCRGPAPRGGEPAGSITLDAYLKGRKVDLIRLDVEGAELDALLGASETLERHGPTLVIEIHPMLEYYGRAPSDLGDLFASLGYQWKPLEPADSLEEVASFAGHILAWKT